MVAFLDCCISVVNKYLKDKGVCLEKVAQLINQIRKQDVQPELRCTLGLLLLSFSLLSPVRLTPNCLFNFRSIASFNHSLF